MAPSEFFEGFDAFEYVPPTWDVAMLRRAPELIALGVWALLLLVAIRLGADRLDRGTASC